MLLEKLDVYENLKYELLQDGKQYVCQSLIDLWKYTVHVILMSVYLSMHTAGPSLIS